MKKESDITKIIMNPIRMRMIQFFLLQEEGTSKQIAQELSDVPIASIYRHLKVLQEANLIVVSKENKIRGTVEKTYQLNKENPLGEYDKHKVQQLINSTLLTIMAEFNHYFEQGENDLQKDMISLSTSTLLLSEAEFMEFTKKIGEAYQEVLANKPTRERKARRITFISSPCETK